MIQTNNLESQIRYAVNKFSTDNIKVCNEWLSGCIEFFASETPGISNEGLYNKAIGQWLLADLSEVGEGCLPDCVAYKKEQYFLDKKYPVQMQWLVDISEPFYDQWRNIYDKKVDAADEPQEFDATFYKKDSKKSRMLKLELTDGKQTVVALEYSPIACLNTKLTPGSKILLTGPIRCVNQVLFLEPKNVKVLGGEVDTLLIENAYENILLKKLGKPINPNPKTEYKEVTVVEVRKLPSIPITQQTPFLSMNNMNSTTKSSFQSTVPPSGGSMDVAMEDDDFLLEINLAAIENQAKVMSPPTVPPQVQKPAIPSIQKNYCPPTLDDDDDFEMMYSLEMEIINEMNRNQPTAPPAQSSPQQQEPPKSTTAQNKKSSPSGSVYRPPQPSSPVASTSILRKNLNILNDFIDESNFFDSTTDFDISNIVAKEGLQIKPPPSILDPDYPYKVDGCSLVTTDQLFKYTVEEKSGKEFVIFSEIDSVAEKLLIKNNQFCLGVFLKDSTNSDQLLQVRFDTNVLSIMAKYTPSELQAMRKNQKDKPQFKSNMNEILSNLRLLLQELKTFMKIAFKPDHEYPIIVKLIDDDSTVNTTVLNKKLSEENKLK